MKVEIKDRFTGLTIISGGYNSIKDCLEKNVDANLRGADLRGAYLVDADLGGANLVGANLGGADLRGANLVDADLGGVNLVDANLGGADLGGVNLVDANLGGAYLGGACLEGACLEGADLRDADLEGAYLVDANLRGARGYVNSHDIFQEIVRQQQVKIFIEAEWAVIAQITIHRPCWNSIRERFSDIMPSIFKKLSDAGFGEWLEYWNPLEKKENGKEDRGQMNIFPQAQQEPMGGTDGDALS